jgi:hypothetical protein
MSVEAKDQGDGQRHEADETQPGDVPRAAERIIQHIAEGSKLPGASGAGHVRYSILQNDSVR